MRESRPVSVRAARLVILSALTFGTLALGAGPALAVHAPEPGTVLPDFDRRLVRNARYQAAIALQNGVKQSQLIAGPVAEPGERRLAAVDALAKSAGPIEVTWDEITGSPRLLFARQGFLTAPDPRDAAVIAREFLLAHRELFLLDEQQVAGLRLQRRIPTSPGGGVMRFHQEWGGIDVQHGQVAVGVTPDGRVTHVMGAQVSGAIAPAKLLPASDPSQVMRVFAAMSGLELVGAPLPEKADASGITFRLKEFREPVHVRLRFAQSVGGPRLAWAADVYLAGSPAAYALLVDDATLEPLRRATRTWFLDTRGRAFFNNPLDSPYELFRFPDSEDYRFDVSPRGWTDESLDPRTTMGNNAIVQDDIAADDEATPGEMGLASPPGTFWSFDHPFTTGGPADAQASLTSLFYGINFAHDRTHVLGFNEPSGNFQADNLGRGGIGGDPVLGDDRDGSGTNNANFQTPPDGFSGRMQMFIWNSSGTPRSSSFETGIVIHEFVHGVSTRLVGGPDDADCLFGFQSGAMGEAWSDYYAASFLDDTVIAEWVSGDPGGIRMFRLDENPPSGKDYRDFCQYPNDMPPQICGVHANGEMWSGLLWLIREQYIATYGPVEGVRRADQLVMDAMKYTPCQPSMLEARDALVLADRLQTGGQMECLIKNLAASRWMGWNATSTGGADTEPVAGNQPWPECTSVGAIRFDREELELGGAVASYACDDEVRLLLVDGNYTPGPASITVRVLRAAVEVDRETLSPAAGDGPGTFWASIRTSTLPGAPADGILQVLAGDVLEATYVDMAPGGTIARTVAEISCVARLAVERHRITGGSCDTDEVPGYPDLPGFIDAGETADIVVELSNLAPHAIAGDLYVTSDNPNLVVLPAGPIPVSFPAAVGTSPASIVVRLRGAASTAITPGEAANLDFTLEAPFYDRLPAARLILELGLDYEVETGLSRIFDVEGETAPVGPEWSTGLLGPAVGNQWTVVTCQNTTPAGTRAFRNGPANCAGRYVDAQGNPYLTSPPLDLFAVDTRAARITGARWQNDIDLGVAGFPPTVPLAVDADAVVVMLTNDPPSLDPTDIISIATSALAFYIRVDIPGFYSQNSNTTGWVLDDRPIFPGQFQGVDLSAPTFLTWYFLPDVTIVQPPLDAQGDGYYLDDVRVEFERVRAVPQARPCTPVATPYAVAIVSDPRTAAACAGTLVTFDASGSEVTNCGPPADLEYRFLQNGLPVACFETDGVTPRAQDRDGWGASATCSQILPEDTTYEVEVRCWVDPSPSDVTSVTMRILDGLAVIDPSEMAFCASNPGTILLDASGSAVVGCPGTVEYLFLDTMGALDCDGDGLPDTPGPGSTCVIGPSTDPMEISLDITCDALPGCSIRSTLTIPAISATADITQVSVAPGGFYCPGSPASFDARGSLVTGCDAGEIEYRYTSVGGFDSGWTTDSIIDAPVLVDDDFSLEVRCSLSPACVSAPAGPSPVLARTGAFTFSHAIDPGDCAGDLFALAAGVLDPPGVRCAGDVEYRFLRQTVPPPTPVYEPITCFDDAGGATPRAEDAGGWGVGDTCWTAHLAGGADFVAEYRCSDDVTCIMDTAASQRVTPPAGTPTGTTRGLLRVSKPAVGGCVAGGDVTLTWADADYVPSAYIAFRANVPQIDLVADRRADVDVEAYVDVGVACDGGGAPYRGVAVYFYLHAVRDTCSGDPLP